MTPFNSKPGQTNADFFAQLWSTSFTRTPFFGSLLDLSTWEELNRLYLEELATVNYEVLDQVELFWENLHGRLHQPDLTIPLADQDFLRTAPLLWGLDAQPNL